MIFYNFRLMVLAALICVTSAQAREASLIRFDPTTKMIEPDAVREDQIGHALRFHLQSMARTRDPQNAPTLPAIHLQPTCMLDGYAPTWWLRPEVEVRRAAHFDTMALAACEFGISTNLLDAVVTQESGYKSWAISTAGAMGLMQIMPGTARILGLASPFDPVANMRAGARYLREQLDRFGRVDLALAAYNAGPERHALKRGQVPSIPETLQYVRTITTNWSRLAQLEQSSAEPVNREQVTLTAVRAAGYREIEFIRYDGLNSANPI